MPTLSRLFDIRHGEGYRVGVIAFLLFLLIGANNLIKILRDTVFLGHHSASELPYLYMLVALVAGAIIALYTKFTASLSLTQLILATNAVILSNLVFFWFLLTFYNPGWGHYAVYIWSAVSGAIPVAQAWTFVNEIFTPAEGRRLFGFVAAGGTLGGAAAGFGTKWAVEHFLEINDLLWVLAGIVFIASVLMFHIDRRLRSTHYTRELNPPEKTEQVSASNTREILNRSRFLTTIALLILVSVIVSTLIDFELKTAAKQAHPSEEALAGFFSSYYAWLSVAAFFAQVVLSGKALSTFGLIPSLYITPAALLAGLLAIMVWPSVLTAALTKMADAALRNSVQRSSVEILYMSLPAQLRKGIKTFLDVVVERTGDATAGFIILLTFFYAGTYTSYVHLICVTLIVVWALLIAHLRSRHLENLNTELNSVRLALRNERPVEKYSKGPVILE